jgi:chromosome segregation ATPase
MPPSRVDVLIQSIGDLREDIGGFRADIDNLKHDRDRDRDQVARNHFDNQNAIGGLRDGTQAAIGELRESINRRFSALERQLENHAEKVSKIQPQITALQFTRTRLVTLASIGLTALAGLAWLVETVGRWAIDRILSMKFGT